MSLLGDPLLLRRVLDADRAALGAESLVPSDLVLPTSAGPGAEVWELRDPAADRRELPAAAAAIGRSVGGCEAVLVWVVVAPHRRGHGLGQRIVEELADVLRAAGVALLRAPVPTGHRPVAAMLLRAGFRRSSARREVPSQRSTGDADDSADTMWFDLEL